MALFFILYIISYYPSLIFPFLINEEGEWRRTKEILFFISTKKVFHVLAKIRLFHSETKAKCFAINLFGGNFYEI